VKAASRRSAPTRVGAGQIGASDQCIRRERAALIGPQSRALPLRRLAIGPRQSSPRHRYFRFAESARQCPRSAAVPMARNPDRILAVISLLRPSAIARPRQHIVELAANHLFDEPANLLAQLLLDRVKPVVKKMRGNITR
jgi:hypothetical protein